MPHTHDHGRVSPLVGAAGSGPETATRIEKIHQLVAQCWCQADCVRVPQAEVKAGRTRSCGRPGCRGPEGQVEIGGHVTRL